MNVEKHYTPEQLATLNRRSETLGPQAIAAAEDAWTGLIAEVQAAMDRGAAPESPEVQALAGRWAELVHRFTGGDPGLAAAAREVWRHEGAEIRQQFGGPTPAMFQYIARARGNAS